MQHRFVPRILSSVVPADSATPRRLVDSAVVKLGLRLAVAGAFGLVAPAAMADGPATAPPAAVKAPTGKAAATKGGKVETAKDKVEKALEAAKAELAAEDKSVRGVVTIERAGQTIALGAVLANDGRILSSLSPLASGNDLDARFADGTVVRVKLGHHDRTWDLALLVPQSGKWKDGVIASTRDPVRADATIRSYTLVKGKVISVPLALRSHRTLLGADDRKLENAIEIGSRVSPLDLGAPLIDEDGRAVGILARGCAPNENRPCTPVAFGAPVTAIRSFLRSVPATAVQPASWLGIQGVSELAGVAHGVRVVVVHPESPADDAHLKGGDKSSGDVILAVDGEPVATPEALSESIRAHGIGEKVPLTVLRDGKYSTVTVLLRAAPEAKPAPPPPANPAELPPANEPAPPAPPPPAPKKSLR